MSKGKRKLAIERTYVLGPYKNIKLYDEVTVPKGFEFNTNAISLLRQLQVIQLDRTYLEYVASTVTNKDFKDASKQEVEEAIAKLDENRVATLEKLKETFASVQEDTEENSEE